MKLSSHQESRGTMISLLLLITISILPNHPVQADTKVITVAPPIPSNEPSFTKESAFTSAILNSTNTYRREHNATAVQWNDTLAHFAQSYLDDDVGSGDECKFQHSGGPYGENLAIGYPNATASIEAWGNERDKFDFKDPGFTEGTGHFTQLVWKNTTDVGCGSRLCGRKGWYLVCEYWPRGNVGGEYKEEVGKEISWGMAVRRPPSFWAMMVLMLVTSFMAVALL